MGKASGAPSSQGAKQKGLLSLAALLCALGGWRTQNTSPSCCHGSLRKLLFSPPLGVVQFLTLVFLDPSFLLLQAHTLRQRPEPLWSCTKTCWCSLAAGHGQALTPCTSPRGSLTRSTPIHPPKIGERAAQRQASEMVISCLLALGSYQPLLFFVSSRWNCVVTTHGPPPMAGHSCCVIRDKMIVFGGSLGSRQM